MRMLRGCLKERMRKVASEPEDPKQGLREQSSRENPETEIAVSSHELSPLTDRTLLEVTKTMIVR